MKEIEKFYQSLMQDVVAMQSGDEEGNTQEQIFTRICLDMLADAAETENVSVAYDERDLRKKGQHKINGYAISDNLRNRRSFYYPLRKHHGSSDNIQRRDRYSSQNDNEIFSPSRIQRLCK